MGLRRPLQRFFRLSSLSGLAQKTKKRWAHYGGQTSNWYQVTSCRGACGGCCSCTRRRRFRERFRLPFSERHSAGLLRGVFRGVFRGVY